MTLVILVILLRLVSLMTSFGQDDDNDNCADVRGTVKIFHSHAGFGVSRHQRKVS